MYEAMEPFTVTDIEIHEELFDIAYRKDGSCGNILFEKGDIEIITRLFGDPLPVKINPLEENPEVYIQWAISFSVPVIDDEGCEDTDYVSVNLMLDRGALFRSDSWRVETHCYDDYGHFERLLEEERSKVSLNS